MGTEGEELLYLLMRKAIQKVLMCELLEDEIDKQASEICLQAGGNDGG